MWLVVTIELGSHSVRLSCHRIWFRSIIIFVNFLLFWLMYKIISKIFIMMFSLFPLVPQCYGRSRFTLRLTSSARALLALIYQNIFTSNTAIIHSNAKEGRNMLSSMLCVKICIYLKIGRLALDCVNYGFIKPIFQDKKL